MELSTLQIGLGIALIVAIILLISLYRKHNELKYQYQREVDFKGAFEREVELSEGKYNTIKNKYSNLSNLFDKQNESITILQKESDEHEKLKILYQQKSLLFQRILKHIDKNVPKLMTVSDIDGVTTPALRTSLNKEGHGYIFKSFDGKDYSNIIRLELSKDNMESLNNTINILANIDNLEDFERYETKVAKMLNEI